MNVALKLYKWASLLYLAVYVPYIIYDDYIFIKKISSLGEAGDFLLFQVFYLIVYFIGFSFYYWLIAMAIVLGYKVIKSK